MAFRLGANILQSLKNLAVNFAPRPLPVWAWRSRVSIAVEIGRFMPISSLQHFKQEHSYAFV